LLEAQSLQDRTVYRLLRISILEIEACKILFGSLVM